MDIWRSSMKLLDFGEGRYVNPYQVTCVVPKETNKGTKTSVYMSGAALEIIIDGTVDEVRDMINEALEDGR